MYFLYRHIRNDNGQPFYIGVGKIVNHYGFDRSVYARAFSKKSRIFHWHNIVKKVGYTVEIIFECDDRMFIYEKEKEFISLYGRICVGDGILCNIEPGGSNKSDVSDETKKKIKDSRVGFRHTAESKLKISLSSTGRLHSDITKYKMSVAKKKQPLNKNTILAASKKRAKTVVQLSEALVFIKEWDFIISASIALKIDRSDISRCCKNRTKKAGGYKWMYKSDYLTYKQSNQ